jgi:non-ribosomal peptide synthase protein (TIGR01720 family)
MYPALVDLSGTTRPLEAAREANEQLRAIPKWGMGYGLLRYLRPDAEVADRLRRMPQAEIFFNYTGPKTIEYSQFRLAGAYGGYVHDLQAQRPNTLAITGAIVKGQLELRWEYSENLHRRETIERLARATMDALRAQIAQHRAGTAA